MKITTIFKWMKKHWGLTIVLLILGHHISVLVIGTIAFAFPNPFRRWLSGTATWNNNPPSFPFKGAMGRQGQFYIFDSTDTAARGKAVVLFCHGRSQIVQRYHLLITELQKSFDVACFNFRSHGENTYGTTSLGFYEADDVRGVLAVLESMGYQHIGILGHSMGGAATTLALAQEKSDKVKAFVLIGTFYDLQGLFDYQTRRYWIPPYMAWICKKIVQWLADYSFADVSPCTAIRQIVYPVLILQGTKDWIVPPDSGAKLDAAASGPHQLFQFSGGHNPFHLPTVATEQIIHFLKQYLGM